MKRLRIGHLSTFYHTAVILMAEDLIGKRINIEAEWRLFGTGPAIVNALEQGELDIAYIGLPPALIGIWRGVRIKCIAGGHIEGTVISGKTQYSGWPGIQDLGAILAQFRGMKIGVPGKGSIHDVILTDCLDRFGLSDEIAVVNYSWADQVTEAMARDELSVAVGTPALAVSVNRFANGKVLYPPSKLWPNNPSYGILAEESFLGQEKEIAEEFLKLHEEATALLRNDPVRASEIISRFIGFVDRDFVFDTLAISPKYCAGITDDYIASTMEFVRIMKKLGYIGRELNPEEIFDRSLITRVHPEKEHYNNVLQ